MQDSRAVLVAAQDGVELRRAPVGLGQFVIGRAPDCQIVVDHKQISRRHARLTIAEGSWTLEDLGSANGTKVDGEPVRSPTVVRAGQSIRMGSVSVELRPVAAEPAGGTVLPVAAAADEAAAPDAPVVLQSWLASLAGRRRYDIGAPVAKGGMGAVLSARENATGRTVAMKVMLPGASEESSARFLTEARVTAQLEHPNIVPVHELGVDEQGRVFYTMKLVKGETLAAVLARLKSGDAAAISQYPLNALLNVFQKVCDAVAFAHSRNVLHRDLKPDNIMIGEYGEVLVMDWGLAKIMARKLPRGAPAAEPGIDDPAGGKFRTMVGMVMGTPQYMAPEQAEGQIQQIDQRTDVYALGAILYHLLALRSPVADGDVDTMIEKAAEAKFTPPAALKRKGTLPHCPGGRIPESLSAVAMRALAKSRNARYPTVQGLQRDIAAFQAGFATSAEHASASRQFALLIRRHKVAAAIALLVLAGLAALLVWLLISVCHARP